VRRADDILNQKDEYLVPFFVEENKRVLGLSMQIKNENADKDFQLNLSIIFWYAGKSRSTIRSGS